MKKINKKFDSFAQTATRFAGSSVAFGIAALSIIVWVITGPIFGYSNTWQLVINTGTTIVTFLMVFLIQRSQNKDSMALQLKLNELVASSSKSSNRLIDIEDLTQEELDQLHSYFAKLADKAKMKADLKETHSVEEEENSKVKSKNNKKKK